jgi:hypothetical protein
MRSPAGESTATAEHSWTPGVPSGFCHTSAPTCGAPENSRPVAGLVGPWPVSTEGGGWAGPESGPAGRPAIVVSAVLMAVSGAKSLAHSNGSKVTRN